jgi:hypothetical protein
LHQSPPRERHTSPATAEQEVAAATSSSTEITNTPTLSSLSYLDFRIRKGPSSLYREGIGNWKLENEIGKWKLETGGLVFQFLFSNFQFHSVPHRASIFGHIFRFD